MFAPNAIFRDVVNDDGLAELPDFMTDRSLDSQLAARPEAKVDFIKYAVSDPAVLGRAGKRREPHPGCATHNLQDRWHRCNAVHTFNVGLKVLSRLRL
jgi:hypothetical protein